MRSILTTACLLLGAILSAGAQAQTVLVLGDSISAAYGIDEREGWVRLLAERLASMGADHEVVNASISGDTTGGGLSRLPRSLDLHEPDVVIIELGGNDGLRGYPIDRIRANLEGMIRLVRATGAEPILVGMHIPPNYGNRYTSAFHGVYQDLSDTYDVALVPFLLEGVAVDETLMQDDGIHPTAAAQPRLLDNLWPTLDSVLRADQDGH